MTIPVEVPHIALATEVEAAHEGPLAQEAAEAPPLPSPAPAETRTARSRSRGGRRKPQAEAPVFPEVAREAVLSPAPAPEPAALPSPAERVEEAKPARKPRRRRSSPAKRAEAGGAGPLP